MSFFFFSSRRRHTRWPRDWSSDVCSSDLFFEGDTVAHCGPTLKGEFARTLNLTCLRTGWVFTRSIRNNAHVHILRSEERRVGKECRARREQDHDTEKKSDVIE